jgi:hypothetical protein
MSARQQQVNRDHRTHLLPPEAHVGLIEALGDTPCTVVPLHLLLRRLGRAYISGDPSRFEAAVIESTIDPLGWPAGEPTGFGSRAEAMWAVLQTMDGWDCVLVTQDCAAAFLVTAYRTDTIKEGEAVWPRYACTTSPMRNC